MAERLEAHFENRVYYFTLDSKEPAEISIHMYRTPYTLIKEDDNWRNSSLNKMAMVQGLIDAVVGMLIE